VAHPVFSAEIQVQLLAGVMVFDSQRYDGSTRHSDLFVQTTCYLKYIHTYIQFISIWQP